MKKIILKNKTIIPYTYKGNLYLYDEENKIDVMAEPLQKAVNTVFTFNKVPRDYVTPQENEIYIRTGLTDIIKELKDKGIISPLSISFPYNKISYRLFGLNKRALATKEDIDNMNKMYSNIKYKYQIRIQRYYDNKPTEERRFFNINDALVYLETFKKHVESKFPSGYIKLRNAVLRASWQESEQRYNDVRVITYIFDPKLLQWNRDAIIQKFGTTNLTSEQYFNEYLGMGAAGGNHENMNAIDGGYMSRPIDNPDNKHYKDEEENN